MGPKSVASTSTPSPGSRSPTLSGAMMRPTAEYPRWRSGGSYSRAIPHSTNVSSQIIEAARLMASASTVVLKKNDMIACSVASRRRGLVRIDTSEVCDAAPNEVAK